MTSSVCLLFFGTALLANALLFEGIFGKPTLAGSLDKERETAVASNLPMTVVNEPTMNRMVRQAAAATATTPSLSSVLPLLMLLLSEASGGTGSGIGGFGGYMGRGGGSSDGRFRSRGFRGKRENLLQENVDLATGKGLDELTSQRIVRSPVRFPNDNTWTEVIPLLRKLQTKTFASANPGLSGKVTTNGGSASCAKPSKPAASVAVFA